MPQPNRIIELSSSVPSPSLMPRIRSQQVGELLDVPAVDPLVLLDLLGVVLVVRQLVVGAADAVDERKVPARHVVGEHERAEPRRVGPERQHHQVEHQPHVLAEVVRQCRRREPDLIRASASASSSR